MTYCAPLRWYTGTEKCRRYVFSIHMYFILGSLLGVVNRVHGFTLLTAKGKGKGKVLPRTGHEGPEREQMYSCTLPSTSVLDGGGWSAPRPGRFTPLKDPVPIV